MLVTCARTERPHGALLQLDTGIRCCMYRIGGRLEAVTPVAAEPMLGYHPCSIGFLTSCRDPAVGQCLAGSLTGAVASERVSEALKGSLRMVGNHPKSAKAEGSLTATPTGGAGTKIGLSDPVVLSGNAIAQRIKSYPGDNRLITPKSSHRRSGLAPRCRLIASWGCSRSQGLGCSPIKAVRELGSERRETVRSYPAQAEDN